MIIRQNGGNVDKGTKGNPKAATATTRKDEPQAPSFTQEQYQKLLGMLSSDRIHSVSLTGIAFNSFFSHLDYRPRCYQSHVLFIRFL